MAAPGLHPDEVGGTAVGSFQDRSVAFPPSPPSTPFFLRPYRNPFGEGPPEELRGIESDPVPTPMGAATIMG